MRIDAAIVDAWKTGLSVHGFEYFPPATTAGVEKLLARVTRMAQLGPAYITITHSGSLSEFLRNVDIAAKLQSAVAGVRTMLHMACVHMTPEHVATGLAAAKERGICNILATRGEGTLDGGETAGAVPCAVELIKLIRKLHGDYFCIGVTGHPDAHTSKCETDTTGVDCVVKKVVAGGDFVVPEFVFEVDSFVSWRQSLELAGVSCPILATIMPIQSYSTFTRLARACKVRIPSSVSTSVALIMDDPVRVRDYGVSLAVSMVKQISEQFVHVGVNYVTLNLETSVCRALTELNKGSSDGCGLRKLPWRPSARAGREREGVRPIFWANRPQSYISRTASWNEFPDARWEDVRNSSFSRLSDAALVETRTKSVEERKAMWGEFPIAEEDVFNVFALYVEGKIRCLPWCDMPLALETATITARLAAINRAGFLTINSQPRANGVPSDDPTFGWGGPGGYVYQKGYVECFLSPSLLAKVMQLAEDYPSVTYTAVDVHGNTYTNCSHQGVNAVTWGVFPSKEVLQPTIVDYESFLAWKDEAFALWRDRWASLYEEGTESHTLLHDMHDTYFLCNLVENDFVRGDVFAVFDAVRSLDADS